MKGSEEILSRKTYDIAALRDIMGLLRSENGCPWDREQTHASIRRDFIEETYEAIEAIDREDTSLLCEELGDVLLQVVFHSQIEEENGTFTFDDVVSGICTKLIHRHPHVFGELSLDSSEAVLDNWDKIKKDEKKEERATVTDELRAVPISFPALMRAQKIGKRAGKAGFDFRDCSDAFDKIYEEADELKAEISAEEPDNARIREELGDLLLSITNVARFVGIDCEEALGLACEKFISRFEGVEKKTVSKGKSIKNMSDSELILLWNDEKIKK